MKKMTTMTKCSFYSMESEIVTNNLIYQLYKKFGNDSYTDKKGYTWVSRSNELMFDIYVTTPKGMTYSANFTVEDYPTGCGELISYILSSTVLYNMFS